jgi:alpha-mannosidase
MPKRKPKDPERSPDLPHHWIERHLARVEALILYDALDLTPWHYRRARMTSPGAYEYLDTEWGTINLGEQWGGHDVTAFFRKRVTIPASHAGLDTALDISLDGGEAQLSIDGRPWQGLDWYRSLVPLGEFAESGREIELGLEAFVINYPYDERRHDERDLHRFVRARLVKRDRALEAFLFDARFVLDAYLSYWRSDDSLEIEGFLLHHLEEACRALGPRFTSRAETREAAARARQILHEHVFESAAYQPQGQISICAHSHLDIVYLWPIKETFRKNSRTATNMLSLMREYPEYRFTSSQPYLYEKLKELYPSVFEEVRQRIREQRWEVIGAMYVEPDGNLLGPESLVRQILFGKRFLREEFGIEAQTCWMPDVFGVVYTLPQVLRKSGVKYFTTVKLNIWNDTNDFPHDTFRWRGLDGSEVIAHFPPTHFGQHFEVDNLRHHWRDFREKNAVGETLFIYGWADGGGGPTREMVETSLRTRHFPGLPQAKIEFAEEFFRRLDGMGDQLAVWDDELYLEAHRGTYTTKCDLKRQNRQAEMLYRDAEILSSLAWLHGGARAQERLNEGWKRILLHQFHDTLPGTHVPECSPDIERDYQVAFALGRAVRDEALAFLAQGLDGKAVEANDLMLFNTLSWPRAALLGTELGEGAGSIRIAGGDPLPVQHHAGRTWFRAPALPALGWTVVAFEEGNTSLPDTTTAVEAQHAASLPDPVIETPFYQLEFDAEGNLARIYDRANDHEVLSAPGNRFQVFEDDPGYKFSAWDIAYHFEEYQYEVRQTSPWQLIANGPIFAILASRWQVLDSVIEQEMWLYADDPRIDFHTRLDWCDARKLLKVAFPLAIRTRNATYDLPFGHVERPTHRNTSWDQAKFEVCGHKWADVSEGDYGAALLNDGRYGYDARENTLRLSLLRSPVRPDWGCDQGEHQLTYSLLPHAGNWRQAHVDRRGYELNAPALAVAIPSADERSEAGLPATQANLQADSRSLIVETLKQAETGDALVLRTFDSHGCHARSSLSFAGDLESAAETDLLEEHPQPVELTGARSFVSQYTPYEIKTHRLTFVGRGQPGPRR